MVTRVRAQGSRERDAAARSASEECRSPRQQHAPHRLGRGADHGHKDHPVWPMPGGVGGRMLRFLATMGRIKTPRNSR
jgi:hypothetical protein